MGAARLDVIRVRKLAALIAFALWLVSLALPALAMVFDPANGHIVIPGYKILTSGYFHIAAGQFGWLANFVLLLLLVALGLDGLSDRILRFWSVVLALLSLDTVDLLLRQEFYGYPRFLPGYYVWMAANLGIALVIFMSRRPPIPDPE